MLHPKYGQDEVNVIITKLALIFSLCMGQRRHSGIPILGSVYNYY